MSEITDLRLDIAVLSAIIDANLAGGAQPEDVMLRACTNVRAERRAQLDELERLAAEQ